MHVYFHAWQSVGGQLWDVIVIDTIDAKTTKSRLNRAAQAIATAAQLWSIGGTVGKPTTVYIHDTNNTFVAE